MNQRRLSRWRWATFALWLACGVIAGALSAAGAASPGAPDLGILAQPGYPAYIAAAGVLLAVSGVTWWAWVLLLVVPWAQDACRHRRARRASRHQQPARPGRWRPAGGLRWPFPRWPGQHRGGPS